MKYSSVQQEYTILLQFRQSFDIVYLSDHRKRSWSIFGFNIKLPQLETGVWVGAEFVVLEIKKIDLICFESDLVDVLSINESIIGGGWKFTLSPF